MTKKMNTAARDAKAIRAELKKFFPKIKFTIRSKTYSGGDNVRVCWVDGPTQRVVEDVVAKYRIGHFDAMTDSSVISNRREGIPQVYYIHFAREFSDFNIEGTKRAIQKIYNLAHEVLPDQLLQKVLSATEFPPREEFEKKVEKIKASSTAGTAPTPS